MCPFRNQTEREIKYETRVNKWPELAWMLAELPKWPTGSGRRVCAKKLLVQKQLSHAFYALWTPPVRTAISLPGKKNEQELLTYFFAFCFTSLGWENRTDRISWPTSESLSWQKIELLPPVSVLGGGWTSLEVLYCQPLDWREENETGGKK